MRKVAELVKNASKKSTNIQKVLEISPKEFGDRWVEFLKENYGKEDIDS